MPEYVFDRVSELMTKYVGEMVAEMAEGILPAIEKVMETVHEDYVERGAIYGDNTYGMLRWMRELAEADRLLIRAAYIQQRHQMLRDLQQTLRERDDAGG